jgi:hypothetical protein
MKGLWIKFKSSSNVGCDRKQEKTSKGKIGFLTFSSQFKLTVQSKISISISSCHTYSSNFLLSKKV